MKGRIDRQRCWRLRVTLWEKKDAVGGEGEFYRRVRRWRGPHRSSRRPIGGYSVYPISRYA